MPKTIIASLREPDMSKSQNIELIVDESVLDEVRVQITKKSGFLWQQVLLPQDDFSILNRDLEILHQELTELLVTIPTSQDTVSDSAILFLYTLDGLCNACIQTGNSLFGYAD